MIEYTYYNGDNVASFYLVTVESRARSTLGITGTLYAIFSQHS